MKSVIFRSAIEGSDLLGILHLNHQIFAEELGQHTVTGNRLLPDRYSQGSHYFVAEREGHLIGMISINATRPFSIERRLAKPQAVVDTLDNPCEIRMLAVSASERRGLVVAGLFWLVYEQAIREACSHLLISAVHTRLNMYEALGFCALGPAVHEGRTAFIPMMLDLKTAGLVHKAELFRRWWVRNGAQI